MRVCVHVCVCVCVRVHVCVCVRVCVCVCVHVLCMDECVGGWYFTWNVFTTLIVSG